MQRQTDVKIVTIIVILLLELFLILPDVNGGILSSEKLEPFDNFGGNIVDSFWGWNILYHVGAVGSTVALVRSDADTEIQSYFQKENPLGQKFADVGIIIGNFWHLVPAVGIYWYGKEKNDKRIIGAGSAGIQAVLSTVIVTSVEKVLTGRLGPVKTDEENGLLPRSVHFDRSNDPYEFRFDFWNRNFKDGRFHWPSGHTSTAFAFVSSMVAYYPEKTWIIWTGYPLALLMGLSVIEGDYHWTSDVVAGALIGHAIGWTVGKHYLRQYKGSSNHESETLSWTVNVVPSIRYKTLLLALTFFY